MEILKNRYLYFKHLLSYRTIVKSDELVNMIIFAESNIDAMGLNAEGKTLFRIGEIIPDESAVIYSVEILIPTDKEFKSRGQCIYKPEFKIDNAVSFMFYDVDDICEAETRIFGYTRRNNMKPITDVYFVIQHGERDSRANTVIEAYVGISSNIV